MSVKLCSLREREVWDSHWGTSDCIYTCDNDVSGAGYTSMSNQVQQKPSTRARKNTSVEGHEVQNV